MIDAKEQLVPRGEKQIKLDPKTPSVKIEFPRLKGLTGPVVHGVVQIDRSDPLAADNSRYFTAFAGPPTPVLIVTPQLNRAFEVQVALAPFDKESSETNVFEPTIITPGKLTEELIKKAQVIWLQDVPTLPDILWGQLAKHVEQGHGLIVTLGDDKINPVDFDRTAAQVLLPAALEVWKPKGDYRMRFTNRTHPLFTEYREQDQNWAVLENDVRVYRYWKVKPAGGARVLATYDDKEASPSVLERSYGKGRVLMFTSGTHLPDKQANRWNNFPSTILSTWMWISFVQQLADYAAGGGVEQFNHLCGEEVTLSLTPNAAERQLLFREPGLRQNTKIIPPDADSLTISRTDAVGTYNLLEGLETLRPLSGFSINVPPAECDLTRLTTSDLDEILGPERYQLARSIDELKNNIRTSDLGQEVFPILMVVLLVLILRGASGGELVL